MTCDLSDVTLFQINKGPNERGDMEKYRFAKEYLYKLSPVFQDGLDHYGNGEANLQLGIEFNIDSIKTIHHIMLGIPLENTMMTTEVKFKSINS